MINPTRQWRDFEAADERATTGALGYPEALRRYAALWAYAREVDPSAGSDWQEDVQADIAVARALNGLPPAR